MGQPTRLGLAVHLWVIVAFSALTFLLTLPVGLTLFTRVPGGGDAWQNLWNLWWVKQAVVSLHTNPYHTDLLYYPQGVDLYLHTLVLTAGIIGLPLQLLGLNLIATYNVILLSSFVLAGYGMFLLCHYLTKSIWASFVGGLIFAFAPYHSAHLYGHMNLVSLQWIPFYVLVLLRAIDVAAPRFGSAGEHLTVSQNRFPALQWSAGAGALLALNAYTDWLYAIFLVLFTALLLIWKLVIPAERKALIARGVNWKEAGLRCAVAGGVVLFLAAPIFFPTLAEASKGYAQQPPLETLVYSSDVMLALTPSELHPIWGGMVKAFVSNTGPYLPIKNPSERVVFLGYSVLLLAGLAFWRLRRDRQIRFWAFVAFATWVLSLGPVLQLFGKSKFTAFEVTIPLPYLLLYKLPLFGIMRTPARLTVLTMLALAILSAFAVAYLLKGRGMATERGIHSFSQLLAYGLPVVIMFEFLIAPFPSRDIVPPGWGVPIYSKIAHETGNFALLELPIRPFGDYMAYQTVHGKPIIGGYIARQPPYRLIEQEPVVKYLLDSTTPADPIRARIDGGQGEDALRKLNVKYAIIRWWAFTQDQRGAMTEKLTALFGGRPPDFSYLADQVDVWQLTP